MLINHVVAATESFAKIFALISRQVGMTERIVTIRIGGPSGIDVVPRRFDAIVEATMPCVRPVAIWLYRLPDPLWRRTVLRMNGQRRSTRQGQAYYKSGCGFDDSHGVCLSFALRGICSEAFACWWDAYGSQRAQRVHGD